MYKESFYNVKVTAPEGGLLLYNTRTGAFVSVLPENRNTIEKLLAEPGNLHNEPGSFLEDLLRGGFVVPERLDEYKAVLATLRQGIEAKVMQLTLLPAETCNFRCSYCYERLRHITMLPAVRHSIAAFVKKLPDDIHGLHISWYGGEPTLAKETVISAMKELAAVVKDKALRWNADMTTNGYLLCRGDFKEYVRAGIRFFQVTIDGVKEDHDQLRVLPDGRGTFDVIWNNLKHIKTLEEDFTLRVRVNFHKGNLERMYDFADLFALEFGHDQRFLLAFRPIWKGEFQRQELPTCSVMEGMSVQNKLTLYVLDKIGRLEQIQAVSPVPLPISRWCSAQRANQFTIGADGALWKCELSANYMEESVGRLCRDGTLKLDNSRLSKWVNPDIYAHDPNCRRCEFLPICQGGCAYNRLRGKPICIFDKELLREAMISRYQLFGSRKTGD